MKVVCAWCAKEGRLTLVDENARMTDWHGTHGICPAHQEQLERTQAHPEAQSPPNRSTV